MAKVTFCWELGGGYGHLASFKPVADCLVKRQHTVSALLRTCQYADKFFDAESIQYSSAPIWHSVKQSTSPTISYADIIARQGYHSTSSLLALVKQWCDKLQAYETELLIVDHSPTALIAAKILNLPSTLFGTGFVSPPSVSPLPAIVPWLNPDPAFIKKIEDDVLAVINKVLQHFNCEKLNHLYELFAVEEDFLCTLPELDHYDKRAADAYWGPVFYATSGVDAHWPEKTSLNKNRCRVFVYTNAEYKFVHKMFKSLKSIDADFLIHCAGLTEEELIPYKSNNVVFSIDPVKISSIANKADLVICHAGHGMVSAILLMGIPLLLIPTQLEQCILANKLSNFRIAGLVDIRDNAPDFITAINSSLNNAEYKQQASRFAEFYKGFNQNEQLEEIVFACEDILS